MLYHFPWSLYILGFIIRFKTILYICPSSWSSSRNFSRICLLGLFVILALNLMTQLINLIFNTLCISQEINCIGLISWFPWIHSHTVTWQSLNSDTQSSLNYLVIVKIFGLALTSLLDRYWCSINTRFAWHQLWLGWQ